MPRRAPTHKPPRAALPDGRPSAAARGYGPRWRELRASVLAERPVCEECGRAAATDVDHVVARAKGGTDDLSNLRAYCHSCHSRKTCREDRGFGRPAKGVGR
jgi:5-methylcytosine-specific restriction protein A